MIIESEDLAMTWQSDKTDYTLVTVFHNVRDVFRKEVLGTNLQKNSKVSLVCMILAVLN